MLRNSQPLHQVHELEKKYACTAFTSNFGETAVTGATLCVELADWRSHQQLRLRFRVAPFYACFVGEPEVEVKSRCRKWSRVIRGMHCTVADNHFYFDVLHC